MGNRRHISTVGKVCFGLLVVAIILTIVGSGTLQVIAIIALVILIVAISADALTGDSGRASYAEAAPALGNPDAAHETWAEEQEEKREEATEHEDALEREAVRYRERLSKHPNE